jgi:Synergist-CTERM protein sorting domain-containing protein
MIDESVLSVSNAPGSPGNQLHQSGTALAFTMAKFRLGASNDTVSVSGVTLTGTGNGNWTTSMSSTNGVQVYRDNGDGLFDAGTDTLLYQGAGQASMNATFTPSLDVPTRGSRDIWVRTNLLDTAGAGAAAQISFTVAIVQGSDVACTVPTVLIGSPPPNGAILNVVDFFVTSVDPLTDAPAGGKQLTITGSGFMSPFTVTIDGVVCPGTPTITPTMVTGIQVPPGSGTGKAIVVTSGTLAPLTLTDTFSYVAPGGGKATTSSSGCIAGATGGLAMLALPVLAALRRRRR